MPCRPQNLRLSPLQRDILWVLEEAGEENVATVLSTLLAKQIYNDEELLAQTELAVKGLLQLGFVAIDNKQNTDDHPNVWANVRQRGTEFTLLLTESGLRALAS